jgi:hypothetical protein
MYDNVGNHKKGQFLQAQRKHSLLYTPTSYIETTNHHINWDDFKKNYAFITYLPKLKAFVVETYIDLLEFLVS